MDAFKIIERFINNFICKDTQERSLFELTHPKKRNDFTARLNHEWVRIFNMNKLTLIPKKQNDYEYIKVNLKITDNDLCYLISNYDDLDNKVMEFKEGFNKSWGRGLGTVIITLLANKIILETEQVKGTPDRFIGKA